MTGFQMALFQIKYHHPYMKKAYVIFESLIQKAIFWLWKFKFKIIRII